MGGDARGRLALRRRVLLRGLSGWLYRRLDPALSPTADSVAADAAQPARRFLARSRSGTRSRSHALFALASIGFLCWPMMCGAQMVGPTPQPQGIPVTPEQAEQVQPESWAIHGQSTFTWLLQPAFRSPYQGPQSLSPAANGRETFDATLYAGVRPWRGCRQR